MTLMSMICEHILDILVGTLTAAGPSKCFGRYVLFISFSSRWINYSNGWIVNNSFSIGTPMET